MNKREINKDAHRKSEIIVSFFAMAIGTIGLFSGVYEIVLKYFLNRSIQLAAPEIVALLGMISTFLGFEKIVQSAVLANKYSDILKHLEELKGVEIIATQGEITSQTIQAIKNAELKIRVTSFKPQSTGKDTDTLYYDALFEMLKSHNVRYECALNIKASNKNRKKSIDKFNPSDQEVITSKMTFFEFENEQRPLNLTY